MRSPSVIPCSWRQEFVCILVAATALIACYAWTTNERYHTTNFPTSKCSSRESASNMNRRIWIENLGEKLVQGTSSITLATCTFLEPANARNLPKSTGADRSQTGTIATLLPIVALRANLASLQSQLILLGLDGDEQNIKNPSSQESVLSRIRHLIEVELPTQEQDFKRLFDAYSDPVSYKQQFLDQNAFLVYYSQGFDGPGRPKMEQDIVNEKQTLQYGARNEAWVAWEQTMVEWKFVKDPDNDMIKYLRQTIEAVDSYLSLAIPSQLQDAQIQLGVTW